MFDIALITRMRGNNGALALPIPKAWIPSDIPGEVLGVRISIPPGALLFSGTAKKQKSHQYTSKLLPTI